MEFLKDIKNKLTFEEFDAKSKVLIVMSIFLILCFIVVSIFINIDSDKTPKSPIHLAREGDILFTTDFKLTPPKVIENLLKTNSEHRIIETWDVVGSGINAKAWLLEINKTNQLYWSFDEFVVAGALIDRNGVNLTQKEFARLGMVEQEKIVQKSQDTQIKTAGKIEYTDYQWSMLENAKYIQAGYESGNSEKALYVFVEPFCGACSNFLNQIQPVMEAEKLDLRLIPVAWISPKSPEAIQTMFDGGKDAVYAHIQSKNTNSAPVLTPATAQTKMAIIENSTVMEKLGVTGTPTVFIKNKHGKLQKANISSINEIKKLMQS